MATRVDVEGSQQRASGFVITSLTEPRPGQQMVQEDEWRQTAYSRPLLMLLVAELR
ncbi:MAG TPA: hypothetical protein VHU17_04000 [Acidimicrobiales bacterium]|jgi:hypothetical protein|nr:hypothetical protein [Acidimicrobiales bacterium]